MDESRELLDLIRGLKDEVERLRERIDHLEGKASVESMRPEFAAPSLTPPPTAVELAQAEAEEKVQRFLRRETVPTPPVTPPPAPELPTEPAVPSQINQPSLELDRTDFVPSPANLTTLSADDDDLLDQQLREQLGEPSAEARADLPPIPPEAVLAEFREHAIDRRPKENMESRIASYWFLRIAVAAIAIGFIYYARRRMVGPIPKITAGYLGAIALVVIGLWRERTYPVWSQPLIAAGLALSYLTTYAMGFIGPMKVIHSLPFELTLLSVNVVLVMLVAEWRKSETIAGVALVLGYMTTLRSQTENYALYSVAVLSVAAIVFIWRNRWYYASLGAVIATYASHLYTWLYLPRGGPVASSEHFRYHAVFLAAYFLVFAIGNLLTRSHATTEEGERVRERSFMDASDAVLLATFTRLNSALYLAGMILLLRLTRIYWEQAWVFFFAYASVTAALSLGYSALPNIRFFYRMIASLSITFGVISYCSPGWLPVLVAVQAVSLLYLADREKSRGWAALSALVLTYSALYVAYRTLPGSPYSTPIVDQVQWWTVAACAVLYLVYAEFLAERLTFLFLDRRWLSHTVASAAAVLYFFAVVRVERDTTLRYYELLLPVGVLSLAGLFSKRFTLLTFAQVLAAGGILLFLLALFNKGGASGFPPGPLYAFAAMAIVFGIVVERFGDPVQEKSLSRTSLIVLFLMQMCVCTLVARSYDMPGTMFGCALVAFGTVALAAVINSRPMLLSVFVPAAAVGSTALLSFGSVTTTEAGRNSLLTTGLLFTAVAAFVGTRRFGKPDERGNARQGEPEFELFLALGAALFLAVWSMAEFPRIGFIYVSLFAALYAAYAAVLGRRWIVSIVVILALTSGLAFLKEIGEFAGKLDASTAIYGCLTAMILVAVERLLAFEPRIATRLGREPLLNTETSAAVTLCLSVGALILLILALHSHPAIKELLFTVAIAAAGCAWIALGFGFGSAVYRRAGFGVICVAIAKAFLYDVWRLPESYIAASFIGLGLFLLPISYIYTKNREKINRWL